MTTTTYQTTQTIHWHHIDDWDPHPDGPCTHAFLDATHRAEFDLEDPAQHMTAEQCPEDAPGTLVSCNRIGPDCPGETA